MPTYNVEKYVAEAVESILNQTFKDFEFIIIDDQSTDCTYEILEKFNRKDHRIRLYQNKINSGITPSLNKALKYAQGRYIARMDGDDVSIVSRIQEQLKYMSSNNNIDLIGSHIYHMDEGGCIVKRDAKLLDIYLINKVLPYAQPIPHVTWFAKKEVFDKVGSYHTHSPAQDYDFILRMKTLGLKFVNIDIYSVKVRMGRQGNVASIAELKRRKAVNYMYRRFREREKFGIDNHTDTFLQNYIESSDIMTNLHGWSQSIFNYGLIKLKSNLTLKGVFLIILSSFVSPYQMQYLLRLLRYKIVVKFSSNKPQN